MSSKRLRLLKQEIQLWRSMRGLSETEARRYLGITGDQARKIQRGKISPKAVWHILSRLYLHSNDRRRVIGMIACAREEDLPSVIL